MRKTIESLKAAFEESHPILTLYLLFSFYVALAELTIYYEDLRRLLSPLEILQGSLTILLLIALPALSFYLAQVVLLMAARRVTSAGLIDRVSRALFAANTFAVSTLWISSFLLLTRKAVLVRHLPEETPLFIKLPLILAIVCIPLLLAIKVYKRNNPPCARSASKWSLLALAGVFLLTVTVGLLPVAGSGPMPADLKAPKQAANKKYPDVVLILIDGAMADYFSLYGCSEKTSPYTDQLANESYVFTRFYPCSFPTFPSLLSIYTGLYPITHKRYTWFDAYRKEQKSIFDIIAAIYDIHFIGLSPERFGFGGNVHYREKRGFNMFSFLNRTIFRDKTAMIRLKRITVLFEGYYTKAKNDFEIVADSFEESRDVVSSLDTVLNERGKKPLFLHIHLIDAHPPFYRKGSSASVKPHVNRYYGKLGLPVEIFRDIEHAYSEHLSNADAQVGEIVQKLRAYRLLDEAVLVVTSDHNLFLGLDKPRSAPFQFPFEVPVRRIPLIIRVPHEKGGYIDHISDHTDIAPTLLDIMGIKIPQYMEGSSMWLLMKGGSTRSARLSKKEKHYAIYSLSEGSGVGLDTFQIIDDHVYVYNPNKKTGRVFDANLNELTDGSMVRRYERIVKEKLGKEPE
jgi:hypothetical protein